MTYDIHFTGHGANVVGSLGSGSLVQNMPPALQFNGTSTNFETNINISSSLGTNNSTFSAWFKSLGGSSDGTILSGYVGGDPSRWDLFVDGDNTRVSFVEHDTNNRIDYTFANSDTEWHQVILTNDVTANTAVLYFDGISGGTCAVPNDLTTNGELQAGDGGGSGGFLNGSIRDVRMYDTELDVTQASALFGGTFTDTADLLIHYDLEDPTDVTPANQGSVSANGTVSNGTWDYSEYNLNQIGAGSVSGSVTVSGGTWNLLDKTTYLDFNGSSAYGSVPSVASLDEPKTIAFWCRPDAINSGANNVVSRGSNDYEIYIHSSTNTWWNYWGTKYSTGADGPPVGVGEWQHIVCTLDDTTSPPTVRWYKDGVLYNTDPLNGTPAYGDDGVLNIGRDASEENDYFDGIIKDVMLYDTKLTDAQVDLLFKGQWVGSPKHYWKLNEGTGNAEDSGQGSSTVSTNNTTWVKPDYDMLAEGGTAGTLVTISGTKLSAPQAELQTGQAVGHSIAVDTYIHNSGTLILDGNTGAGVDSKFYDYGNTYYNITKEGAGYSHSFYASQNDDTVVENTFDFTTSNLRMYYRLNMGTTGSRGTLVVQNDASALIGYNAFELYGVSELFPVFVTSSAGGGVSFRSTTRLSNVEWDFDQATRGGGYNYYIDGNCEFQALWIKTGDLWHASGQRLKFNGQFTNSGSVDASGAQFHFTTAAKPSFEHGDNLYSGDNDTQWWIQKEDTHRFPPAKSLGTILANQTGNFYSDLTIGSNTNNHTNFLLGGTDACQFTNQHDHEFNNFKLGVSSLYIAGSNTTSIHGNMTNGGGMHGVFTASFNGTDDYMKVDDLNASYNGAATAAPTGYLDAWIRTTDADGTIINQRNAADSTSVFKMRVVGGKPAAQWITNGVCPELTGTTDVDDGIWHHIAWRGDGTDGDTSYRFQSLYVDGKLEAHDSAYTGWLTAETQDVFYGANSPTEGGGFFDGDISRICIIAGQQNAASANNKIRIPTEADLRRMAFMDYYTFSGTTNFEYSGNVAASPTVQWYQFDAGWNLTTYDYSGWAHVSGTGAVSGSADQKDFWYGDGLSNPNNFQRDTSTLDFPTTATSSCWGNYLLVNNMTVGVESTSVFNICRFQDEGPISYYGTFKGVSGSILRSAGGRPGYQHVGRNSSPWTYMRDGSNFEVDVNNDEIFGDIITYYYSSGTVGALPKMKLATLLATQASGGFIELAGDLDVGSVNPDAAGAIRTNGYNIKATYFNPYGSAYASLQMNAGSDLTFTNARSWNYTWPDDYDNTFSLDAQGIAGANFQGMSSSNRGKFDMHADTNFAAVANGGPYSGSASFSYWAYLPPNLSGTLKANNLGYFGGGGGGQTGGGFCSWSYQAYNPYGGIYWDIAGEEYAQRSSNSYNWKDGDIGKLHHIVNVLDRTSGTAAGEGNLQIWVDGAMVASGNVQTSTPFTAVSSSAGFNWAIGHGNLSWPATSSTGPSMMISDFRIYKGGQDGVAGALTPENIQTLYNSGNTIIDGTGADYSDPDNALGAATWYKLDRTSAGLTSLVDSVSGSNGHYDQNYAGKTGFCTMSGSGIIIGNQGDRGALPAGGAILQNFYSTGTTDYIVGNPNVGYETSRNLITKGTVVLD